MKKHIRPLLLGLVTIGCGFLQAQTYSPVGTSMTPEERAEVVESRTNSRNKIREKGIEQIVITKEIYKKGKIKHTGNYYQLKYDAKGQLVRSEDYSRRGKLTSVTITEYDDSGNTVQQTNLSPKGRPWSRRTYKYEGNLLKSTDHFVHGNGRHKSHTDYAYDTHERLRESTRIKPKSDKIEARYVCTYHEDGSKKRVERFNKKGKMVSVTDYACDQSGKTASAQKAQELVVCERFESDANGETIKVVEAFIGRKDAHRQICKYNERGHLLELINYDEAGNALAQSNFGYDDKGNLLSSEYRNEEGKVKFHSEYERNEKGLTTQETAQDGKGSLLYKNHYDYSYY